MTVTIKSTSPSDKEQIDTVHELSNGDTIHVHAGGDVWLYKGGDVKTARYFRDVPSAMLAAEE